ncbi:hypothetical protein KY331_01540 [Candidatus Woesearchaeota archaeon]|nr:hypothetical protein [Candidatus Woesearchaeota archaeon]
MKENKGYWVVYEHNGVRWPKHYDSRKEFLEKKDREGGHVVDLGLSGEAAQRLCVESTDETLVDKCFGRTCDNHNPPHSTHHRIHSSESTHFENDF